MLYSVPTTDKRTAFLQLIPPDSIAVNRSLAYPRVRFILVVQRQLHWQQFDPTEAVDARKPNCFLEDAEKWEKAETARCVGSHNNLLASITGAVVRSSF
ncbi:hypothetical protein VTN49DRAFT_2303 [Thermomyces lanuginosus]|uniref:uncharacterized protein n=1 Tax=Thermomyces lanuginosus TaxID=5541 RepID=UPI0037432584